MLRKLLHYRNGNHFTEISRNSGKETEWNDKSFVKNVSKIWEYLARLSSFPEKPKMTVPFAAEMFRNSNQNFRLNGSHPESKCKQFLDVHVLNIYAQSFPVRIDSISR